MQAVVVASGQLDAADGTWLDTADLVIAADGGAAWLERVGRAPDLLVGDLDSADPALVDRLAARGVPIEQHPVDKDASDTELAVDAALARAADCVFVLGALGGDRLDHELANLLLLADPAFEAVDLRVVHGSTVARALHGGRSLRIDAPAGSLVSLLPLGADVHGVTTTGLRWPLDAATLRAGRSRGLSNEVVSLPASVAIQRGTLLIVETCSEGADHP